MTVAEQTELGSFLNESGVWVPGEDLDTFDDAPAPANDLIADGTDFRDEYYQETNPFLRNVGRTSLADGEDAADGGIMKGTLAGDTFEGASNLVNAFTSDSSITDKIAAITSAAGTAGQWGELAKMGTAIAKGSTLAKFDPFNFLGSQLMSWMLEHVEPLRKTLDSLAGNPDMVEAYSASWTAIAQRLTDVAQQWATQIEQGTAEWIGAARDAYRAKATELAASIAEKAALAEALAKVNDAMLRIVEAVRGVITEVLSSLAGMLAEITALLIASAGTATPALIARALFDISMASMTVSQLLITMAKELVDVKALAGAAKEIIRGVYEAQTAAAGV
ncbi:hypothetical protein BOX37_11025 [Nocardia mangyaensis]|uniref:ESX-1 secretion-associated protein EspA/EspE-like domain-containing protein n=1 Tax=Nocardia mangyaensis TaxID=2213200 RepID=A0A1J0VQW2_9NOCA|nr:hypothetical protein [Nocardia mangyaensis]APE34401.1 hypothetical protein BOX37_11025 [Nocardia mangyaensis]